jgi:2-dehydro-3-deoxyphosphogluconate aldolase/(4S)-4-hydroxy-2-oxoglutarate aldolase
VVTLVTPADLLSRLRQRKLLAIIRATDAGSALACIEVLAEEGIDLIEVSLTSVDALALLAKASARFGGDVVLGAGTVMTADQARASLDAGASYLVTPALGAGADEGVRMGAPVLMGALTPTEVASAMERGATAVKLFPAELGGPRYAAALRAPFPDVPFVPVGGVDPEAARAFLDAGCLAVGVGSPLMGDAASGGDLRGLRTRARDLRSSVAPWLVERT